MKATIVNKEGSNIELGIEVTGEELSKAVNTTYIKTRQYFQVDGFRKGKAPRHLIEAKYGKNVFLDEALTDLFNDIYSDALEQVNIEPIDYPEIDYDDEDVYSGNGFTYRIKTQVAPDIELTPEDYKGIKVVVPESDVTDKDIDEQMESIRKRNARLIPSDKAAENEDTVVIDYAGFMKDGTQFDGGTASDHKLKLGSKEFIPGFEDQLVGAKAGDDVDVKVAFPMDYPTEALAGQRVTFKVKVKEVLSPELPDLDDDFAKEVSEFDTLEEFKKDTKEHMEKNRIESNSQRAKNHAIEVIYNKVNVDIPDAMIEHELDDMMKQFDQQLGYQGADLKSYLQMSNTTTEEFRDQMKDQAIKKVKTRLIVLKIAELEGCEADSVSVEKEIARLSLNYGLSVDEMRNTIGGDIKLIEKDVLASKALEKLFGYCDIEEVPMVEEEARYQKMKEELVQSAGETEEGSEPAEEGAAEPDAEK